MNNISNWIWTGEWRQEYDQVPTAVLFRKKISIQMAEEARIRISADSRYKLYINGVLAEAGPSKGDHQIWFYDEIDVTGYLQPGQNVLSVIVLRFPQKPGWGNQSIMATPIPGLYVSGRILEKDGREQKIAADQTWSCQIDEATHFVAEGEGFAPLHFFELAEPTVELKKWKQPEFDDSGWQPAVCYPKSAIRDAVSPGNLNPRTIPFMRRKQQRFPRTMAVRQSVFLKTDWNQLLAGKQTLTIPPETEEVVEFDAGEEMTGYLHLLMEQGKGAEITLLQAEAYIQPDGIRSGGIPLKTDRTDYINGRLEGYTDHYRPAGWGNGLEPEEYEPFWFRTFRFIQMKIITKKEPLVIRDFYFEETGYPLEVKTKVETSDKTLSDIWDISVRTMKRCMQETYTDCPFYEQLQYAMDSRSQMLFTYTLCLDDRLAKKCMDDFMRAQRYDGLISSAYPNTRPNVIPGFSVFYILMLHDHMMYFGDQELIRYHFPSVEQVLYFFEKNRTKEGHVGKIGGLYRQDKFWSFIDWAPEWQVGVPNAAAAGAITMESLLYLLGLLKAAELAGWIGRKELATEYLTTAEAVKAGIRSHCMNSDGWIQDGPGVEEYSQHCQVFGILTGTVERGTGAKNLLETLKHREKYAQCTVSMALYLFQALEMTGLYEYTDQCWDIWRQMVANNMTTVAESDVYPRSECHAWGALALYELPSVILGVRPAAPGYEEIKVNPVPGYLSWAKGDVITPKGLLHVEWERDENGEIRMAVVPENKKGK